MLRFLCLKLCLRLELDNSDGEVKTTGKWPIQCSPLEEQHSETCRNYRWGPGMSGTLHFLCGGDMKPFGDDDCMTELGAPLNTFHLEAHLRFRGLWQNITSCAIFVMKTARATTTERILGKVKFFCEYFCKCAKIWWDCVCGVAKSPQ